MPFSPLQAILDESDDEDIRPAPSNASSIVIDVNKVLAYDSGTGAATGTVGFVRITSIRDVEADDEKTLRESCNFSMVSPLRSGFLGHEQCSGASVIQFSHLSSLSSQITGDKARSLWGLPTCLSVHAKIVACGTSLGCVVLFDHFEGFRCVRLLPAPRVLFVMVFAEWSWHLLKMIESTLSRVFACLQVATGCLPLTRAVDASCGIARAARRKRL
jgi:hypothetical protein